MGNTLTPDSLALIIRMMSEDSLRPPSLRHNEYLLELEMFKKDGSTVWTEVSVHVLRDDEGNITGFQGGTRDITERRRTEGELRRLLIEKDILLKELQHRVKNNLKVISGLLAFESDRIRENHNGEIFRNAISRIESMAVIYESLYLSDNIAEVELHSYIKYLADSIFSTYNIQAHKINLTTSLDEVNLDLKRSVPLGLVLNELISNSLKYAYPYETGGNILVALSKEGTKVTLKVEDNGAGFPDDFNISSGGSMGFRLVKMLTDQIGGELDINHRAGARVSVSFML
jgi:two-component sensor histidine kinase